MSWIRSAVRPEYKVFDLNSTSGGDKILATVSDAPSAYIHSLFDNTNQLILIDWQADFGIRAKTFVASLLPWIPKRNTLFYIIEIIDKKGGGVIFKYTSDGPVFAFHSQHLQILIRCHRH